MRFVSLGIITVALSTVHVNGAEPIKPAQFAKLHALIRPQESEERFMQIPWRTNLWDARKEAAAEGKPIILWEMDGHPLSCV
jgi:hypothetical protein